MKPGLLQGPNYTDLFTKRNEDKSVEYVRLQVGSDGVIRVVPAFETKEASDGTGM